MFKTLAISALINNLSIDQVRADQPVHCTRDDAYGVWDFHVNTEVNTINLFEVDEVCTHKTPNHVQIVSKTHQFKFDKEELWKVNFL